MAARHRRHRLAAPLLLGLLATLVPGVPLAGPTPLHAAGLEAVVAARMIRRGETIDAAALALVAVRSLPGGAYIARPDEAVGLVAKRTIVRGRLVPRAALAPPDHVARGASLTLRYVAGPLRISVPATALGAGRVGDTLTVRVQETGALAAARILGPDTAELVR